MRRRPVFRQVKDAMYYNTSMGDGGLGTGKLASSYDVNVKVLLY